MRSRFFGGQLWGSMSFLELGLGFGTNGSSAIEDGCCENDMVDGWQSAPN